MCTFILPQKKMSSVQFILGTAPWTNLTHSTVMKFTTGVTLKNLLGTQKHTEIGEYEIFRSVLRGLFHQS